MVELCIDGTSCQACDFELCRVSMRLHHQSWSHVGTAEAWVAAGREPESIMTQASLTAPTHSRHSDSGCWMPGGTFKWEVTDFGLRYKGGGLKWREGCSSVAARIKPSFAPVMPQISRACLEPLFDGKAKGHGLWPQRDLGSNPGPAPYCHMTLGRSFNLSELQFFQMRGFENICFFYTRKIFSMLFYIFLYRSFFYK